MTIIRLYMTMSLDGYVGWRAARVDAALCSGGTCVLNW